jgi:anti-sigma B factor antagonist
VRWGLPANTRPEVLGLRLNMSSTVDGRAHVISLAGELDLTSCTAVETELRSAEAGHAERIVVDLSRLDFIDSTGIGLLVAAQRRSDEDSGRLRLIRSRSVDVDRLLELCGLDRSLPFTDN